MTARIGIDTGGTFTDLVAFDADSGHLVFHKVASTPDDPSRSIVQGAVEIVGLADLDPRAVDLLVHGTTVATNTVLQRAGAKAALITTFGFRDVLHIQRQDRARMYDLRCRRARPLISRELRLELNERITYDGMIRTPLDQAELSGLIERLEQERVEAVAVCFLHSYANPSHEREVGRIVKEKLPGVTVCLSHELVGEHGEYERFSTCAMNAYVQPKIQRYLDLLENGLAENSSAPNSNLFVMKSNGGVMSAGAAGRQCVETILSGPAGGVVAGAAIAAQHTNRNLITADMGGTSFDVSVIHDGQVEFARQAEMGGLALGVPMLDIHTVGAGGGSIAWIDAGGSLRVGPRSAGAAPGPACYGQGGAEPTVTDANLVLGRLAPMSLLGGGMEVDLDAARRSIQDKLAEPLRLTIDQAAEGIIRVVNATMTAAIGKLTVERGHDPREYALCAFGGAGPLHGAELAAELGLRETIVPIAPGVNSAIGLLMSNLREDRIRTHVQRLDQASAEEIDTIFRELQEDARRRLAFATVDDNGFRIRRTLGQRYVGQRFELPVRVDDGPLDLTKVAQDFHAEHHRMYGYARTDEPVELSSVWLSVEVDLQTISLSEAEGASGAPRRTATRAVIFGGRPHATPIYSRRSLGAGAAIKGPAVIEQLDATTVLWPDQMLTVDDCGQLLLGPLVHRS